MKSYIWQSQSKSVIAAIHIVTVYSAPIRTPCSSTVHEVGEDAEYTNTPKEPEDHDQKGTA